MFVLCAAAVGKSLHDHHRLSPSLLVPYFSVPSSSPISLTGIMDLKENHANPSPPPPPTTCSTIKGSFLLSKKMPPPPMFCRQNAKSDTSKLENTGVPELTTNSSDFKTPLKPVQVAVKGLGTPAQAGRKIADLKAIIQEEMASMNMHKKPSIDPISASAKKPPVSRNLLLTKMHTPQAKKVNSPNLTHTFKYDPKCVTGIPWIKPKKTTVPDPFTFASDRLAAKRAISGSNLMTRK